MPDTTTQMRREIEEIPDAVARLLDEGAKDTRAVAAEIARRDPRFLISVARGSSDHACSYLKYASELLFGLPMASVGPSVASIYGAPLKANGTLCLAVSQSGQSPDIVELTRNIRESGAYAVAITNDTGSPLAGAASATLGLHAGPEISVAATKSFVTSLVAGLWVMAEWKRDEVLLEAIRGLPEVLDRATRCDWSAVIEAITGDDLYTLGRGPSWAISNEAALKFKETCRIHAESYSSAEVLHGPVEILRDGFPVIGFAAADKAETALVEVAEDLAAKGARVFVTSDKVKKAEKLDHVRSQHWLTDPIPLVVSFYGMVEQVAVRRGINPDVPRNLTKVTATR